MNDPDEADGIIVNTCGFINDAKRESINKIFHMTEYKKRGGILIVSGCLSQRYGEELYKEMPEVDHFSGGQRLSVPAGHPEKPRPGKEGEISERL